MKAHRPAHRPALALTALLIVVLGSEYPEQALVLLGAVAVLAVAFLVDYLIGR